MDQVTLVGRADVRAAVLPARAAYLVKAGDRQAALTAVREASTRWAGVTEPIIPVRASGRIDAWWVQVVELSNVDGLVNVSLPPDLAEAVGARFGLSVVDIARIDRQGETRITTHPVNLGAGDPEGGPASWVMAPEDASLWQSFAAGDYYMNRLDDLSQTSVTRLPDMDAVDEVCRAQFRRNTWLDAGVRQFTEHATIGSLGATSAILWVTKPNSLRECVFFWNLRALRHLGFAYAPMALLPDIPSVDWERLAETLVPILRRPDEVEPDVVLFSLNADEATLDRIGAALGLVQSSERPYSRWSNSRRPPRQPPYTYRHDIDPRDYVAFEREYGQVATTGVQVYRHNTRIEFDSPVRFRGVGKVLIRLESDLFDGLPRRAAIASMIREHANWRDDRLQIPTNATDHYRLDLLIPSLGDAAWKLIRERCSQASPSDKGRMAVRLLELGGHEVLLDSDVRETIEALRTRRSQEVAAQISQFFADDPVPEELAEFAQRLGETQQRRSQSIKQLRSAVGIPGARSAETLCHQGWAERGLSIKCDRCSVRSFVPLEQTQPEGACPACLAAQPYELDDGGAPELQYRLNGLIDRAADQGVLPHLMAIAALRKENERTFLIPGADVVLANGTAREVDLFGTFNGAVVAGEAKTSPAGFENSDIEADIGLSAALGAETHLMVATNEIASGTVQRAKQLARDAKLGLVLIQGDTVETVDLET